MDLPANKSTHPPIASVDPDALPPSPARRAQLLFILIVLPVVAVSLPAIFVTLIFGQHPKKAAVADTSGLKESLKRSAGSLLPAPAALTGEPIRLTCRPDRLAARAQRVIDQARSFGGQANEFLGGEGEKHFYVELPAGRAEAFRQSLAENAPVVSSSPAVVASPGAGASATKDQVEVFIRASQDE